MPNRSELESWICDALRAAGGKADTTAVRQYIWLTHEDSLRAAGPKFFSWQVDVDRVLFGLKRRGLIRLVRDPRSTGQWEVVGDMTNAFEALCGRASEESWCWNLGCTTCANHDLRYGLAQIGLGRHPACPNWERISSNIENSAEWPSIFSTTDWPAAMRSQLADTLSGASLKAIPGKCRFPDWLGYLGIALHLVSEDEELAQRLTKKWLPELRSMVQFRSTSRDRLKEVSRTGEALRWHHIDGLEQDLRPEYQPPQP